MMFLSSFMNAKFKLVAGMVISDGMALICREMCKKKECFQTDDWGYGKEWQKIIAMLSRAFAEKNFCFQNC